MGAEQSKKLKRSKQNVKPIQNRTSSSSSSTNSSQQNQNQSQPSTTTTTTTTSIISKVKSKQLTDSFEGKIVVVSRGEQKKDENLVEKEFLDFLLNHQFSPLMPKSSDTIPANYQQIDSISMTNLCKHVQNFLKEKSDLTVKDQNMIYERIKKIDYVTAFIANLIVEKEKSQNKIMEIFNRLNDMKILTKTYQTDLDRCFKNVVMLNNLLDGENRIEINDL